MILTSSSAYGLLVSALIGKLFYFKPKLQGEAAKGIIKKSKPKGNKKGQK